LFIFWELVSLFNDILFTGKENLIERTQHPKGEKGLEQIQNLEDSLARQPGAAPESEVGQPPVFTSQVTQLLCFSNAPLRIRYVDDFYATQISVCFA